ncbi:MAG TPA: Flp pilus assembly protein CpaB [Kouleothrix sp.]|uniref:Flp pilus assembly protein CpaB n=1 Tax=Kouleothrix sp. TaxID=2779161 RepID=UPI002BDBA5E8|nr:Flp pilus assembly protein CpaB [Kouleothrix sp.]HRC74043.1 Flp pilus assembly protein CpaB [Kouleothrix sp.]
MRRGGRLFLLLGLLIIVIGALAYFVLSQPQLANQDLAPQPTQELKRKIVIARIDIPNNTVITDTVTFLTTIDIPESEFAAASGQYFTSPEELLYKQTLRAIAFNDRIRKADITEPGLSIQIPTAQAGQPRVKAITFQVNNLSGVADQIRPGDFVDVLSSFIVKRTYLRPGFSDQGQITIKEEPFEGQTTKTLLQNVQVLQIRKPAPAPEGTPTPGGPAAAGPPQTDTNGQPVGSGGETGNQAQGNTEPQANNGNTFQPGSWLLLLAVTDQQAELLKFSLEQGTGITLVLRGRGDAAIETTTGATLDLLVSQYGLPLPQPALPAVSGPTSLTPLPTTGPAQPAGATPTPTTTR